MSVTRALVAVLIVALCVPAVAAAKKREPLDARVEHVAQLPAPAAIGANFKDGYMFVTGTSGLWVYDVTNAEDPQLAGSLPLPHYESEDVSIGGNRLLISGDGTAGGSTLFVVDISDPTVPKLERVINMQVGDEGHTATCIQDCHYVWVAGGGSIAVLNLEELDQVPSPVEGVLPGVQVQGAASKVEVGELTPPLEFGWSTHDVQVDEAGYGWVVGGNGTVAYDLRPEAYPVPGKPYPENLLEPTLVARTGQAALNDGDFFESDESNNADTLNDFIHHNSWRPDASEFESRSDSQTTKKGVRDGELVLITEEDIWSRPSMGTAPGGCETQGSFQTWQVKQFGTPDENTSTVQNLDSWTTEFNEAIEGDDLNGQDVIPTKGFCSSHYFDEQDGIVATAWYEQGIRFLDVSDPKNIEQVGFFIAPGSTTWAAYWSPTDRNVVYVVDNNRGVDVLTFNRKSQRRAERRRGTAEVEAPMARWWFRSSNADAVPHPEFGWVCRLPK